MNYKVTLELLRLESNNPVAFECLDIMSNGEILYNEGFIHRKEHLLKVYKDRLKMAESFNREKFSDDEIEKWQIAINSLENSNCTEIAINWLNNGAKHFLLFWDTIKRELVAIFYLLTNISIEEQESHSEKLISMGFGNNSQRYSKGKFIENRKHSKD